MAFPVPSHLPRKKNPQDVSTEILTKISDTSSKTLTANLASSWVEELSVNIAQTKRRIHERISKDLPAFNEQLAASKSVQDRLRTLTINVDNLNATLSDPETGLIPTLLATLRQHSSLAQEVEDADVHYHYISSIHRANTLYRELASLIGQGKLPDAVQTCRLLDGTLRGLPSPLDESAVVLDLKHNFRASKNRTDEQLNDAYSRSIKLSSSELIICPSVQVRQSETTIQLSSILLSLSSTSLASQLTTLRRDLIALYIERICKQPSELTLATTNDISGVTEHRLSLSPSPSASKVPASRLETLSALLTFLDSQLFPHLPTPERISFPRSLTKPIRESVLQNLLISSLPESLSKLPDFLGLVRKAVEFEETFVVGLLGDNGGENAIKAWADNVAMHYERKRRTQLLDSARVVIAREHSAPSFRVEIELAPTTPNTNDANGFTDAPVHPGVEIDSAWGLETEKSEGNSLQNTSNTVAENGWDFDDEFEEDVHSAPSSSKSPEDSQKPVDDEDPEATWGFDDESDDVPAEEVAEAGDEDDSVWDAWNDEPQEPAPSAPTSIPKPAKRLEKFSSKGKSVRTNGHSSPPVQSPALTAAPPPTPAMPQVRDHHLAPAVIVRETYLVSGRTQELLRLVQHALTEADELDSSAILSAFPRHGSPNVIAQAAPLMLDLYRGLYPVARAEQLCGSPKLSMSFSNDCLYMSCEVDNIAPRFAHSKSKLLESGKRLKELSATWFDETIDRQTRYLDSILDQAEGFVDTMDQDRFDTCESAVNAVLQHIRRLASQWKDVLAKSKYYEALGAVVNAALSRILRDILALPDITADESHRLCELCHVLNALEGQFVEDPAQPSFVVSYVPSWLKYSYLSELLEASIADISYLFEEGLLVDFEIDELVQLVRALFAETPLRTNTINRLLQGHPVRS